MFRHLTGFGKVIVTPRPPFSAAMSGNVQKKNNKV
ncbi:hypothetical protein Pvag_pPag20049 (plasmid) [Pantoea vagans C9-1]|nr:hypothetical protein Pvag_pPag20049 [Pantoea vagans C9-1]